jgi:hypothetical protein
MWNSARAEIGFPTILNNFWCLICESIHLKINLLARGSSESSVPSPELYGFAFRNVVSFAQLPDAHCASTLKKQDRQCTYNVTMRRVHTAIVVVGKAISITYSVYVCLCVCSLTYPSSNTHAPYCHLWPMRLGHNFPHYLKESSISGGGYLT